MTTTANLAITKIEASQAQKEVTANEAYDVLDAALSLLPVTMTDANYTLSTATVPQQWQYGIIELTGALTATRNVVTTDNMKEYTVSNLTSGGHSIVFKTSGGTGITVANGVTAKLYCDGSDIVEVTPAGGFTSGTVTSVNLTQPAAGITVSGGPITTSGSITLTLADDLAALEALSSTGILHRTGSNTYALRTLDTDGTLAANSDTVIASQKAVKTYADSLFAANDAMLYKGVIDCSANPNYPAADAGHVCKVSVAGKIGGGSGPNVEVGDTLLCTVDGTSSGTHGAVGANWNIVQVNLDGAVIGPASSTNNHVAFFNGTTGKVISDSGLTLAGTNTGDETTTTVGALINGATAKTTPVDADFFGLMDSAASNILKKLSWANVKATLKAYSDTLYAPLVQPFCISLFYPGVPGASALVGIIAAPANISTLTFAAAIAGSSGKACTAATAQTDFDVRKNATTNANGTSVGTIRFAAAGSAPTFIAASGFTLTGGSDYLSIWAPASADATLADIGITLYATR